MIKVKGVVVDETGQGLPMANVFFSDSSGKILPANQGTATSIDGDYEMTGDGAWITASYVGYNSQTKPFGEIVDFELSSGTQLQEVEIIGEMPKTEVKKSYTSLIVALVVVSIVGVGAFFYFKKP